LLKNNNVPFHPQLIGLTRDESAREEIEIANFAKILDPKAQKSSKT
jgi:hypothetical protein